MLYKQKNYRLVKKIHYPYLKTAMLAVGATASMYEAYRGVETIIKAYELYNEYGTAKTLQDHHWIEQSRINNTKDFPFLQSPPMKKNLLDDKSNLSLIVGHNGAHLDLYNQLLDEELKVINGYLINNLGAEKALSAVNIKNAGLENIINDMVNEVIQKLQAAVKKDSTIMNTATMFILD